MAFGEITSVEMSGAVPFGVRLFDHSGNEVGEYSFLGWFAAEWSVEPVVLYQGKARPIRRVLEGEKAMDYLLVFPTEPDAVGFAGREE